MLNDAIGKDPQAAWKRIEAINEKLITMKCLIRHVIRTIQFQGRNIYSFSKISKTINPIHVRIV